MISSRSPLSKRTKGCVHGSSIGKLNLSFCFGVRSACRNTVTFAFSNHVELSPCASDSAAACKTRSGDERTWKHILDKTSAALSKYESLPFTKLQPFTSMTWLCAPLPHLSISNPHTVCPKPSQMRAAHIFSSSLKCVINRISLPSVFLRTTPSTTGDFRVSACVYSGPKVYTLISSELSTSMNFS